MCIWVTFGKEEHGAKALINTTSNACLMPSDLYDAITQSQTTELKPTVPETSCDHDDSINCLGTSEIIFSCENQNFKQQFHICDGVKLSLGVNFVKRHNVLVGPAGNRIWIKGKNVPVYDTNGRNIRNRVCVINTMTLKPGEEVQVSAQVKGKGDPENNICILDPAKTLFARTGALVAHTCVTPKNGRCPVRLLNASEQHVTLYKNMTVGVLQPVEQITSFKDKEHYLLTERVSMVGTREDSDDDFPPPPRPSDASENFSIPTHVLRDRDAAQRFLEKLQRQVRDQERNKEQVKGNHKNLPDSVKDLFDRTIKLVPKCYHDQIHSILAKHSNVFAKDAYDTGRTTWVKHDIDTGDHPPVRERPSRLRKTRRRKFRNKYVNLRKLG